MCPADPVVSSFVTPPLCMLLRNLSGKLAAWQQSALLLLGPIVFLVAVLCFGWCLCVSEDFKVPQVPLKHRYLLFGIVLCLSVILMPVTETSTFLYPYSDIKNIDLKPDWL